jgi:hypothetical protein
MQRVGDYKLNNNNNKIVKLIFSHIATRDRCFNAPKMTNARYNFTFIDTISNVLLNRKLYVIFRLPKFTNTCAELKINK